MGFTPAVSKSSGKDFRRKIKEVIQERNTSDIVALSEVLNPIIRGWMNYFMKYNLGEAFRAGVNYVNLAVTRWLTDTEVSKKRNKKGTKASIQDIDVQSNNVLSLGKGIHAGEVMIRAV